MTLRYLLERPPETIEGFVLAAEQRHLEGLELTLARRYGAAVYLMGYAAEMLLKAACFRFDGAGPRDPVSPLLAPARSWQRRYFPTIDPESYHSLKFWCNLLLHKRGLRRCPLSRGVRSRFARCVNRMYTVWWIEMRYRPDQAGLEEAQIMYNEVEWVRNNHRVLWR
jgi:hypothetical protein